MKILTYYRILTIALIFLSTQAYSYHFNTNEVINTSGGDDWNLSEDEGYLLLSLNTDLSMDYKDKIDNLTIKSIGFGNNLKFYDIQKGENFALLKLKAGTYYWDLFMYYFKTGKFRFNYDKDEYAFKVEPGVINYPGTWNSSLNYVLSFKAYHELRKNNQLALELKKLRKFNKDLFLKYEVKYQGDYEDRFFQYYKEKSESIVAEELHKPITFDISDGIDEELNSYPNIKDYFLENKQSIGEFSPEGKYLSFILEVKGYSMINILNLDTYETVKIFQKQLPENSYIQTVKWIDKDSIYYNIKYDGLFNKRVAHLKITPDGKIIGASHLIIDKQGGLLDPLINEGNKVYFASSSVYSKRKNGVYLLDLSTDKSIKKSGKKPITKIKKLIDASYMLTDSDGEIRFLIIPDERNEEYYLEYWFMNEESQWNKIHETKVDIDNLAPIPILISKDNQSLYVLTNKFSDKNSIHKYSTSDFSHKGVFYENNDIEITGLYINSSTHEILGVRHIQNGIPQVKYFENKNDDLMPLRKQFPNHNFYIAQQNKGLNKVLVFGTNEYSKGSWSIYDTKTKVIDKLFETNPQYTKLEKGRFHTINLKASDGVDLEGYLVLPQSAKHTNVPLVVMPHGGPIGVRDYAISNEEQHFFASQGIATLKVNFRGSGGFGKEFEKSGQRQWGEKIEADIFQMTNHVTEKYNIAKDKICSMGASYGGYSSVMLSILYPDTYKCAISFAGVMDIPLMFTASDTKDYKYGIKKLEEVVGNPKENMQELMDKSPVYLAEKAINPILLFHGLLDKRVNPEQSIRMKDMLDFSGHKTELIFFNNEGHGFSNPESQIVYIAKSIDFLKKIFNTTTPE